MPLYNKTQLLDLLSSALTREVTLACESNLEARKLSWACRRLRVPSAPIRISVSQSDVILSPRKLVRFEVKEEP